MTDSWTDAMTNNSGPGREKRKSSFGNGVDSCPASILGTKSPASDANLPQKRLKQTLTTPAIASGSIKVKLETAPTKTEEPIRPKREDRTTNHSDAGVRQRNDKEDPPKLCFMLIVHGSDSDKPLLRAGGIADPSETLVDFICRTITERKPSYYYQRDDIRSIVTHCETELEAFKHLTFARLEGFYSDAKIMTLTVGIDRPGGGVAALEAGEDPPETPEPALNRDVLTRIASSLPSARSQQSRSGEAKNTEMHRDTVSRNPVAALRSIASEEYILPEWLSYHTIQAFFDDEQMNDIGRGHKCKLNVIDRRSPVRITVSTSDDSTNLWKTWLDFTQQIAATLDEELKPRFLYDVILYNYAGRKEKVDRPVLRCCSPFNPTRITNMAILPFPSEGNCAGYLIRNRGYGRKLVEDLGCQFDVFTDGDQPTGKYALVAGEDRDAVKEARDMIQSRIDEYAKICDATSVANVTRRTNSDRRSGNDFLPDLKSRIEYIVQKHGPFPMARLKPLFRETFHDDFDQNEFGYDKLGDFLLDVPSIDISNCKRCVLELSNERADKKKKMLARRTILIRDRPGFIGQNFGKIKFWQNKFRKMDTYISIRGDVAIVTGPEDKLDAIVDEIEAS